MEGSTGWRPGRRLRPILLGLGMLLLTGCGLLQLPEAQPLPPPIPTAPALDLVLSSDGSVIIDPSSNLVPRVDPELAGLLAATSQQQISAYVRTLESFGTRNAFSPADDPTFGVGAARRWILDEFRRVGNGRLEVRFQDFTLNYAGLAALQQNVIATLPGTSDGVEVIVIMAHYDTRPEDITDGESLAPGANDNGSGVALLLESARLLSSRQWHHTIIFAALAAEEQGTHGARQLATNLFLDNFEVIAAINYDQVGGDRGIPRSIRLFAQDLFFSPAGELGRYYAYIGGLYVPTFPVTMVNALDREGRYGDHREFTNLGLPAVRLTQSVEDQELVNSRRDTWTRVDYSYLQSVVQLNVAVAANLATAPAPPELPVILAGEAPGSFLIRWRIQPEAAAYAFSFRPVESAELPPFRFVRAIEAGTVMFTGLDPFASYGVSLAMVSETGRLGRFTPEVLIEPAQRPSDQTSSVDP